MRRQRVTTTLSDVRAAQPEWFSRKNKRFFGDVTYKLLHSGSGKPYLVRYTAQWSDMFGEPKTYRYRINVLEDGLKIGKLLDEQFHDLDDVKMFLRTL